MPDLINYLGSGQWVFGNQVGRREISKGHEGKIWSLERWDFYTYSEILCYVKANSNELGIHIVKSKTNNKNILKV